MTKVIDNDTWHESARVHADDFTIEFVEGEIAKAKEKGATVFRTQTDRDNELCAVICYAYKPLYMPYGEPGFGELPDKELSLHFRLFPNLYPLKGQTKFQVYREFKPRTNIVELTVYYREPDSKDKMRIDAEIKVEDLNSVSPDHLSAKHVRIVGWGLAVDAVNGGRTRL